MPLSAPLHILLVLQRSALPPYELAQFFVTYFILKTISNNFILCRPISKLLVGNNNYLLIYLKALYVQPTSFICIICLYFIHIGKYL